MSYYDKALDYIKQNDPNSAVIELKNAIQIDPKFADARYQLALIQLKDGKMREAFGQLKRVADLDPANTDAGVKVGEFYLMGQNSEECRKYTQQVLAHDPQNPDGLALLANLELVDGNLDAALAAVDKVDTDLAKTDRFLSIKGRIYATKKDFEKTEDFFKQALAAGPGNIANYRALLLFYQQQKRMDDAEKILTQLVTAFPENVQAHLLQANFYDAAGKPEPAEKSALTALDLEPENESLITMIANLYEKQGKAEKAAEFLEKELKKLPESASIKATLANIYYELRRFDDAQAMVDSALASNPDNGGANFVKAKLLLNHDKASEAIDLLTSLTANYPKWADPFYFLALARLRSGDLELAGKAASSAVQLAPTNSRYHVLQAQLYLIRGEANSAGQEATMALRLDSRNVAAARMLAKALLMEKRFDDAVKLTTALHEQAPDDIEILGSQGLAYLGTRNDQEAEKAFSRLLEIDPGNAKALALLVGIKTKDNLKSAIAMVQKQIELAPKTSGHYLLLGDLLLRDKQPETALNAYAEAQKLAPQNPQPYIVRARIMNFLGKRDEALKEFQDLLVAQPDSVPARMGIAALLEMQHKYSEAKEQYQKVLAVKPDQAAAANNLAYLITQENEGDLGEALRLAMLAKQSQPDDPHVADTLGMVHYKRDAYPLAISQFQQALITMPDNPTINYHLALAQLGDNDKTGARASIEKALASSTAFPERAEAEQLLKKIPAN
ncbi:MAG: tetratricopeptide repeat protein [Desulfopila sp.]